MSGRSPLGANCYFSRPAGVSHSLNKPSFGSLIHVDQRLLIVLEFFRLLEPQTKTLVVGSEPRLVLREKENVVKRHIPYRDECVRRCIHLEPRTMHRSAITTGMTLCDHKSVMNKLRLDVAVHDI